LLCFSGCGALLLGSAQTQLLQRAQELYKPSFVDLSGRGVATLPHGMNGIPAKIVHLLDKENRKL